MQSVSFGYSYGSGGDGTLANTEEHDCRGL